jgi:segregation and condensation protein B
VNVNPSVEAILFASDAPLSLKQVQAVFPELEQPSIAELELAVSEIMQAYSNRPIELIAVASGYRFQVREAFSRFDVLERRVDDWIAARK